MAISQTITALPTAPTTADPASFRARGDAFLTALNTFDDELNTVISQINSTETNINSKEASATASAVSASTSQAICTSTANFQGTWTNQTTVLGQSWYYNGVLYRVLIAGNTSPIASPSNWVAIIQPSGKNYIINGGFDYWNYATSQTMSGYGSDDRWYNFNFGSTKTHSQVASTDTERALFSASKFSRTVVTSVVGATNRVDKFQRIENVTKLAGKTVTISFWAKANSTKNIAINLWQEFGTGGSNSATITGLGKQLVSLTSAWQKKTITVSIPSIIGKTLGTDGVHTTCTTLQFWFDAGSSYSDAVGLGQQSGTFDIAEVKLEEGSVATPWTPYEGEFGGEIQACQRYYEAIVPKIINYRFATSGNANGVTTFPCLVFNTIKRIPPTSVLFSTPSTFKVEPTYGSVQVLTNISVNSVNVNGCTFNCTVGSTIASLNHTLQAADTTAWISFSSEL